MKLPYLILAAGLAVASCDDSPEAARTAEAKMFYRQVDDSNCDAARYSLRMARECADFPSMAELRLNEEKDLLEEDINCPELEEMLREGVRRSSAEIEIRKFYEQVAEEIYQDNCEISKLLDETRTEVKETYPYSSGWLAALRAEEEENLAEIAWGAGCLTGSLKEGVISASEEEKIPPVVRYRIGSEAIPAAIIEEESPTEPTTETQEPDLEEERTGGQVPAYCTPGEIRENLRRVRIDPDDELWVSSWLPSAEKCARILGIDISEEVREIRFSMKK